MNGNKILVKVLFEGGGEIEAKILESNKDLAIRRIEQLMDDLSDIEDLAKLEGWTWVNLLSAHRQLEDVPLERLEALLPDAKEEIGQLYHKLKE